MMKRFISKLSILTLMFSSCLWVSPVSALGVTATITPNSVSTSPTNVLYAWTRSAATTYVTGTTITITVNSSITHVSSSSMGLDIDGNSTTDTLFTSTSTNSVTFTVATTTASTSTFSLKTATSSNGALQLTFDSTGANYSISVFVSNQGDSGSALFYANGGNQVAVSAMVPAALVFSIRNSADTASTSVCALGTLSALSTSTCSYRLRLELANAANGFTATIQANHDLGSGSATITAATNDGPANAGTEGYGISVLTGATAGGRNNTTGLFTEAVVEGSEATTTFNVDVSPVPTTTYATIISYPGPFSVSSTPSLTGTSLVTHFANISAGTPAGNYTQTVTYLVTASF